MQHSHRTTIFAFFCTYFPSARKETTQRKILCVLNFFINKIDGLSPNQLHWDHLNSIPVVQDLLTLNILAYDRVVTDGNIMGELTTWGVQKKEKTVWFERHNNHICLVSNNGVRPFESLCWLEFENNINPAAHLEPRKVDGSERIRTFYFHFLETWKNFFLQKFSRLVVYRFRILVSNARKQSMNIFQQKRYCLRCTILRVKPGWRNIW